MPATAPASCCAYLASCTYMCRCLVFHMHQDANRPCIACLSILACCRFGDTLWHSLMTILSAVVVDFLLLGFAIATACW